MDDVPAQITEPARAVTPTHSSDVTDCSFSFVSLEELEEIVFYLSGLLFKGESTRQYVYFSCVPSEVYTAVVSEESTIRKFGRISYCQSTQILIVKMATPLQELATEVLRMPINRHLVLSGMDDFLHSYNNPLMVVGDWIKQPNCSWGRKDEFPALSMTVETGLTESDTELASDAAGWLESEGSTVKIVLTVSISENTPKFVVKKWCLDPRPSHVEMHVTPLIARCVAQVAVSCFVSGGPATVSGDKHLIIPSKSILRNEISSETDIVLTDSHFLAMAKDLWAAQAKLNPSFPRVTFSDT